jgi:hypothetical protein
MGGLWRKLWWRALCVLGLVFAVNLVPILLIAVQIQLAQRGALDFAGGSVVHFGPLALFLAVPWLAVEGYNLRHEVPAPFGSYVAFAIVFAVTLQMTGYVPQIPRPEWGWAGMLYLLIVFGLASSAGLVAGWAYARLTRKKPRPEAGF